MSSVNYKKTRRATKKAVRVAVTPPIHNLYKLKVKPSLLSFPTMSEMTTTDIKNMVQHENNIKLKDNWNELPKGTNLFELIDKE